MVSQIDAPRLAELLDAGEEFSLIDTRPADSYEAWRVPGAHNVPHGPDADLDDEELAAVERAADAKPVVTICGKGLSSTSFAIALEERGYDDVSVVKGGMEDWSTVYERTPVATGGDAEIVQIQRRARGCLGYVIGAPDGDEAVAVDATRQTDEFVVAAQAAGYRITGAIDTHVHADHVSGGPQLAADLDVPYYLGAEAADRGVEYGFEPLADGDAVAVGDCEITALHAPGHTPEMLALAVGDDAVLTADTLFLDSVGRTELAFGDEGAERGAELLYDSLHETLLDLADDATVLPGHVTVREDGTYADGSPGEPIAAPLGELRESLDLLGLDRESFVERVVERTGEPPANYEEIVEHNLGRAEVDDERELLELETGPNNCAA